MTKETPVFNFKQNLDSSTVIQKLTGSKDAGNKPFVYPLQQYEGAIKTLEEKNKNFGHLTLYEDDCDPRKDHELSEESEEGQFERDGDFVNEEPSTNVQTQGVKEQTERKPRVEIHNHFTNFGQMFLNKNPQYEQIQNYSQQHQFLLPIQQFQVLQQQSLMNMNQRQVIRQLSFRSNSNASSSVHTPL